MLGVHGQHQSGGKDLIQIHRTVIQKQDLVVFLVLQSLGQQAVHRNAHIPAEGLEATVAHQLQRSLRRPLQNEGIRLISHCTRHLYRAGKWMLSIDIRLGAKSVTQLEMMPKAPDQRAENNPWPEWPKICKTDYGQEEAIAVFGHDPRIYQTTVTEFIKNKKGEVCQIKYTNSQY